MFLIVYSLFSNLTCETDSHVKVIVKSKVSAHDDNFDLLFVLVASVGLFDDPYLWMKVGERLLRVLHFIHAIIHEG